MFDYFLSRQVLLQGTELVMRCTCWLGAACARCRWSVLFSRFKEIVSNCCFCCYRCGSKLLAEAHCSALVIAIRKTAGRSKRVHLFGRCLGLLEPVVPTAGA